MDEQPAELDDRSILAVARAAVLTEKRAGCQLLEAAAAWADLHPSDSILTPGQRLEWYGERAVLFGGQGTPDVAETAAGTLGAEIGMNPEQAKNLIADALDARHRFPRLWAHIQAGHVRRDTVHRVGFRTRHLTCDQAAQIDSRISHQLTRLVPGQRLDNLLDAEIKRADQEDLEPVAAEAIHSRSVRKSRPDDQGMTDIWIHTTEADADTSMSAVDELADILIAREADLPTAVPVRDAKTKDEWRTVAAHLLIANPVLAVQLRLEAQRPTLFEAADTSTDDQPAQPEAVRAVVTDVIRQIDPSKLQPTAVLHVHISDQALDGPFGPADPEARIARVERLGPMFLETVRQWLGQACTVELQTIIDTSSVPAVDRYEFTPVQREAILTRSPASVFPWSNSLNRRNDLDHTRPYLSPDRGGPPGQTSIDNGGPLTRREHRYKTHGPVAVRQPDVDTHVWKTRYGRVLIVNPSGTFDLGTGAFARASWVAAERLAARPSVGERVVRRLLTTTTR